MPSTSAGTTLRINSATAIARKAGINDSQPGRMRSSDVADAPMTEASICATPAVSTTASVNTARPFSSASARYRDSPNRSATLAPGATPLTVISAGTETSPTFGASISIPCAVSDQISAATVARNCKLRLLIFFFPATGFAAW